VKTSKVSAKVTKASAKPKATKPKATQPKATQPKAAAAPARAGKSRRTNKLDGSVDILERFRSICLGLPEATEVEAWGHPTFRVRDKIFAAIGAEQSEWSIGVKTTHELQAGLVASDPRFTIAKYVGKHGWVNMQVDQRIDWSEVEALVNGSYRLIAPKALAARVPE
jgi:predicted DNA-binding protein (MmcQ/YjbR family)